jgi:hypothetical protein
MSAQGENSMPIKMTPRPEDAISTVKFTPDGLDPATEWFEVLSFTRSGVIEQANKDATSTITKAGGKTEEKFDNDTYYFSLFKASLKGWQLQDEHGAAIPFTEENIKRLPWTVRVLLRDAILSKGGIISTEEVVVTSEDGATFHAQGADAGVGAGEAPGVPDTLGNPVVPQGDPGN